MNNRATKSWYMWIIALFACSAIIFFLTNRWNTTSKASVPITLQPSVPSLRLSSILSRYTVGERIPIDVMLQTGDIKTTETVVVISYDPAVFAPEEHVLDNAGVYPVINIENVSQGVIVFSLFTDISSGYAPVSLVTARSIATVYLRAIAASPGGSSISIQTDASAAISAGVYGTRVPPSEQPKNELRSVQGVHIFVE